VVPRFYFSAVPAVVFDLTRNEVRTVTSSHRILQHITPIAAADTTNRIRVNLTPAEAGDSRKNRFRLGLILDTVARNLPHHQHKHD
jgi:hypothetical protein